MRAWLLQRMKERLEKEAREGPPHASELFSCWRKTIRNRQAPPELTEGDIIRFIRGYAVQTYVFGEEEEGQEVNGIIFSPDLVEGDHILEFKTTAFWLETKSKGRFDPTQMGDWVERTKAYTAMLGKRQAHIVVYFVTQNEIVVWSLDFTDAELEEARRKVIEKRDQLQGYMERGELPPVTTRAYERECGYCKYLQDCTPELEAEGMLPDARQ